MQDTFRQFCHLTKHRQKHHKQCFTRKICNERFKKNEICMDIHIHTREHMGVYSYNCKDYEEDFPTENQLAAHSFHTGEGPFRCGQCDHNFFTNYLLEQHVSLVHVQGQQFRCTICDKDSRPFIWSVCEKSCACVTLLYGTNRQHTV